MIEGQPLVLETKLQLSKGPRPGEEFTNSLGMVFSPPAAADGSLISDMPMSADLENASNAIQRLAMNGDVRRIGNFPAIALTRETADALCEELSELERSAGYIPDDHLYEPAGGPKATGFSGATTKRARFHLKLTTFASLTIITNPVGAEVWLNGEQQPTPAPVTLEGLKTGTYEVKFRKEGFEDLTIPDFSIAAGSHETLSRALSESRRLVFGKEWSNSLDMKFLPMGDIMLCAWETRREDYDIFADLTGRGDGHVPKFRQEQNHPVVGVNREDAEEFCRWLTAKEQVEGLLDDDVHYRLPTDLEWSQAAGREAERGSTPMERDRKFTGVFPWGFAWPPPNGSGNFAESAQGSVVIREALLGDSGTGQLEGYAEDGHAFTAPVGSFDPDKRSKGAQFYDLAGNVWEWVADDYDPAATRGRDGVLRGGSWNTF